ncbi:MAG: lipid-A-disaccharide synthase [Planctomycetaceae bacterium]|nr:lipid-A-disaccharide synthase [Planctomycetaceae bacterium]MDG2390121.1 lipid-A-disaccharide synthase [Planctomycetaceae bacterium]
MPEIFFSVGEPSGDQHAAHLIEELKQRRPDLTFTGFGGPEMREAGCDLHFQLTDMAVMGLFAVLPLLRKFFKLADQAEQYFQTHKPDAVILVDFPGFNWSIAKRAKAAGIPVYYFSPPQIWAWATWRVERMRKYVDHVLCGLSFEPEWYAKHGIEVEFVGHPFFDEVAAKKLNEPFCLDQHRDADRIVGVLPGSRNSEVQGNFPDQLKLISRWHKNHPEVKFLVACYRESQKVWCEKQYEKLGQELPIEFHIDRTSEIIEISDCCVMVSGSVSLELLARTKPAIVMYNGGLFMWVIGKTLLKIEYISLPNLFENREVFPEFYHMGPVGRSYDKMFQVVDDWLSHPQQLIEKQAEIERLKYRTVQFGAISKTADAILKTFPQPIQQKAA